MQFPLFSFLLFCFFFYLLVTSIHNQILITLKRKNSWNVLLIFFWVGYDGKHLQQSYGHGYAVGSKGPLSWEDMLESCENASGVESQVIQMFY